jgi:hypothetical protein
MKDLEKQRKYRRDWYHRNAEQEIKKAIARNRKNRRETRDIASTLKLEVGCKLCGYNKCPGAMDFHHRDRKTKSFNIASSYYLGRKKVLEEIEKCDILCRNCHAELEYNFGV